MKTAKEWVEDAEGRWDAEYVRAIQADMWHSIRDKIVNYYRDGKTHKEAIDLALKETLPK